MKRKRGPSQEMSFTAVVMYTNAATLAERLLPKHRRPEPSAANQEGQTRCYLRDWGRPKELMGPLTTRLGMAVASGPVAAVTSSTSWRLSRVASLPADSRRWLTWIRVSGPVRVSRAQPSPDVLAAERSLEEAVGAACQRRRTLDLTMLCSLRS